MDEHLKSWRAAKKAKGYEVSKETHGGPGSLGPGFHVNEDKSVDLLRGGFA